MRIDDPRHDRLTRHVHPCGAGGNRDRTAGPDRLNPAVGDDNRRPLDRSSSGTVNDACTRHRDGAAAGRLRERCLQRQARKNQQQAQKNREARRDANHGDLV
jgi:hypothetical protein